MEGKPEGTLKTENKPELRCEEKKEYVNRKYSTYL